MSRKKGQAAMEFLMTYGWAILVVLVAIGALAYFGVLSPDRFLPEKCMGPSGFECIDKAAIDSTGNTVSFVIKNNAGYTIDLATADGAAYTEPAVTDTCGNDAAVVVLTPEDDAGGFSAGAVTDGMLADVVNGQRVKVVITCAAFSQGRFKSDITFDYYIQDTDLPHKATVSITGVGHD